METNNNSRGYRLPHKGHHRQEREPAPPFIESALANAQIPSAFIDDLTPEIQDFHIECVAQGLGEDRVYKLIQIVIDRYRDNVLGKTGPAMRDAHNAQLLFVQNELIRLREERQNTMDAEQARAANVAAMTYDARGAFFETLDTNKRQNTNRRGVHRRGKGGGY